MRLKVYTAGKLSAAPTFKKWLTENPEFVQGSSWLDLVDTVPDSPEEAVKFWPNNVDDVRHCDVLLCLAPPADSTDQLRGALVEVGVALGWHKPVLLVGYVEGTWQDHPRIWRFKDLAAATDWLNGYASAPRG